MFKKKKQELVEKKEIKKPEEDQDGLGQEENN